MAEMTAAAASAVSVGVSAAALNAVGLEPVHLGISFMACLFGAGMAPEMSRARQLLVFCAAVVCSAVLGKYAAQHWLDGAVITQAACVIGLGLFFHPLVALVPRALPRLTGRWLGTGGEADK